MEQREIEEAVARIVRKHADSRYRVFLFGSRATGAARRGSDYDIGIEGPAPLKTSVLSDIEEEIENLPTLATIEIVDFANVSPSFRQVATMKTRDIAL